MYWTDRKIRKTTSLSTKTENQRLHWRKSMNHARHQNQNTAVCKCVNEPKLAKSTLFSQKEKPYRRDWFRACLKLISWFRVMLQAMFVCFYYIHVGHIVACCTNHTPNYLTCILIDLLQDDLASPRVEKLTGGELQ